MADEPENAEGEDAPAEEPAAPEESAAPDEPMPADEPAAAEADAAEAQGEAAPAEDAPVEDAAPTEPGSETEADAEANAVPEDVPENAEPESSTADEPAAAPAPPSGDKDRKDVVPGADLEPIAIGEEERELTAEERARREAEEEERAAREARATADDDTELAPRTVNVPDDASAQATGKRKSAVARVIVRSGSGDFRINDRSIEEYFPSTHHQSLARQPLVSAGYDGSVDVRVRVHGGGTSGQAGAVRHGVARALTTLEPELRGELKRRGLLTRDDRRKERKKAGLKKARKRPQFSKR